MNQTGKSFEKIAFHENPLKKGEYENCTFTGCHFTDTDLSDFHFSECTFSHCNLSMVRVFSTAFRDVKFVECKLLGLRFDTCMAFGLVLGFENCTLNYASFYGLNLKKTVFRNCSMQETDLTECDLTGAVFDRCDFTRATFDKTILVGADFRTAFRFSIDPAGNRLKKAKFSMSNLSGLLDKYDIEIEP
jgi:fluoroquinolone resistance protein